jgi:hypothetical protein
MSLAAGTVYVAVDQALLADGAYMAVAVDRGVYAAGDVPDNQRLSDGAGRNGYTEIAGSLENPDDTFGMNGGDGVLTLTVRATSKRWALVLAKHVHRVLHGTPITAALGVLTADSQALVRGDVRLIEDFPNPDGGHTAVLQYLTSTVSTA